MSVNEIGMEDLVRPEYGLLREAQTDFSNAISYWEDTTDLAGSAELWATAAVAASRISEAAENLSRAAWKIQREREDAAEVAADAAESGQEEKS